MQEMKPIKISEGPKVYLVSRPQMLDGVWDFLKDVGTDWAPDRDISDAEALPEIAGRLCYMSFNNPRPGGNKTYLKHILESQHGCYDAETDVLTSNRGWVSWPDVEKSDSFVVLDPETEEISVRKPKEIISYFHKGKMYRVDSQPVDLLVTPDHRMLACRMTTKAGRKKEKFKFETAEELGTVTHAYLKTGIWNGPDVNDLTMTRDIAALLGFSIGDGHLAEKKGGGVQFHLRRERKITWLVALSKRLRWELGCNGDHYRISIPKDYKELFLGIYDDNREKQIPDGFLMSNNSDVLEGLYEGLMQSDGHIGRTGDSFDTTSNKLAGQFQHLCLFIGLAANVCYVIRNREASFGNKPLTRLSVIRRCLRPEVNRFSGSQGRSYWIDGWEGDVYCADVGGKALYVRRNGIPVWSGNSVIEHCNWSFIFTGVSRTLTHELVRHRSGWSYSQLSQRYVDETDAEFICPEVIAKDEELKKVWETGINACRITYASLVPSLIEHFLTEFPSLTNTELRKKARQAARSVLPNATETKIFVTANARAIRHFLEMRCSRHAETEIRVLAGMVWKIMVEESPNLFGDYEKIDLEDGTFELKTEHRKV